MAVKTPISILADLDLEARLARYPNHPRHAITRRNYPERKAAEVEAAIVHCIKLHGWQASTVKVMGRPIDTRKKYTNVLGQTRIVGSVTWVRTSASTGMADIDASIVPAGGTYAASCKIEVKFKRDTQKKAQKRYESAIVDSKGFYIIVHTFADFWAWFEAFTGLTTYEQHLALVIAQARKSIPLE